MKIQHWLAVGGVVYFLYAAVQEVGLQMASSGGTGFTLPPVPDWGTILNENVGGANSGYVEAAANLASAGAIYALVLHKKLF